MITIMRYNSTMMQRAKRQSGSLEFLFVLGALHFTEGQGLTADLTSTCLQTEVDDHPANLGMMGNQNVGPQPLLGVETGITATDE